MVTIPHAIFLAMFTNTNNIVTIVNNPTVSITVPGNAIPDIIITTAATILPTKFPIEYIGVNIKSIVLHLPNSI